MWRTLKNYLRISLLLLLIIGVIKHVLAKMNLFVIRQDMSIPLTEGVQGENELNQSDHEDPHDQVAIMGDWAFWIDKTAPLSERFMAAPVKGEDSEIDFSQRTPINALSLSDPDMQALFNVLDFLGKKVEE